MAGSKNLKSLFVKEPFKNASGHLLEAFVTVVGAYFGFYLSNTLIPNLIKKPATEGEISPQSIISPVLTTAVGMLGTMIFVPGMARSFSLGVAVGGGVDLLSDVFMKDKQFKFGLQTKVSGLGGAWSGLAQLAAGEDMDGEDMFGEDMDGDEMDGDEMDGDEMDGDEMEAIGAASLFGEDMDGEDMFGEDMDGEDMFGEDMDGAGDTLLEKVMYN